MAGVKPEEPQEMIKAFDLGQVEEGTPEPWKSRKQNQAGSGKQTSKSKRAISFSTWLYICKRGREGVASTV